MKVSDISKAVGKENAEVAAALGIETTQGYWLREVDDKAAADYLAAQGVKASERKGAEQVDGAARFWCKGRSNRIEGDKVSVQFDEWVYACDGKSNEAKLLRSDWAWARFGVAEVFPKPYEDAGKRADFIRFVETIMFTGQTPQDGPSRVGHKCAAALLTKEQFDSIPKTTRNKPAAFARAIADKVSLGIDLGMEG